MAPLLSARHQWPLFVAISLLPGCGGGDDGGGGPNSATPTVIAVHGGDGQSVRYGTPVPVAPSVVLSNSAGIVAGVPVTFAVTAGTGEITGATSTTDAQGVAAIGGWILGPVPGVNTLKATAGSLTTQISATATSGPPASITITQGDAQTWVTQSLLPIAPAVVVSDGQFPVAGAPVVFSVGTGGGSILGPQQTTLANGLAIVGGWRLGSQGANTLIATVANTSISVTVTATAEPLVISAVNKIGDYQEGFAGNFARKKVAVSVLNQFGRPAEGVPVSFRVSGGDGTIAGTTGTTATDGEVVLGSWRYGTGAVQMVEATAGAEAPVTLYATTASLVSDYRISIFYPHGVPNGAVSTAFSRAVTRWQALIVGNLPSIVLSGANGIGPASITTSLPGQGSIPCIPRVTNTTINDINIYAYVRPIDGAGGILGFATPIYLRSSSLLPFAGCMVFDEADMEQVITNGSFESVVLHEMAHVFGFGTIWSDMRLLVGACPDSATPSFNGPSSQQAFLAALSIGATYANPIVPVEGEGSCNDGTRDGHWSESVFGNELMTGYLQPGSNPLSAITSASLRDMGYVVNDAPSSGYGVPMLPALRAASGTATRLHELHVDPPLIVTDARGATIQIIDRGR